MQVLIAALATEAKGKRQVQNADSDEPKACEAQGPRCARACACCLQPDLGCCICMLINRISHQRQLIAPGTTAAHVREVARQACLQKWLKLTLVFPAAQSIRDLRQVQCRMMMHTKVNTTLRPTLNCTCSNGAWPHNVAESPTMTRER